MVRRITKEFFDALAAGHSIKIEKNRPYTFECIVDEDGDELAHAVHCPPHSTEYFLQNGAVTRRKVSELKSGATFWRDQAHDAAAAGRDASAKDFMETAKTLDARATTLSDLIDAFVVGRVGIIKVGAA